MQYQKFLESKVSTIQATGFKPDRLNPNLFLFQRDIVEWALQLGKAAIFAGCGLGKSLSQSARLQTFPDDIILSGNKGLDCKAIGNAVPCIIMQKILEECFE